MGFGGSGDNEARRARNEEVRRQKRISDATKDVRSKFGLKYNDQYYSGLRGAMDARYDDDVKRQYTNAVQNLQAALARAGLGNSTVGAVKTAYAKEQYDKGLGDVERAKNDVLQQRKQAVSGAENDVINQLNVSADKDAAFANAEAQIKANYAQPVFPILGQLFTDFAAGLDAQSQAEKQGNARYNLGVSNWGQNAQRYFRNIGG